VKFLFVKFHEASLHMARACMCHDGGGSAIVGEHDCFFEIYSAHLRESSAWIFRNGYGPHSGTAVFCQNALRRIQRLLQGVLNRRKKC
jgi:hypothetical protein